MPYNKANKIVIKFNNQDSIIALITLSLENISKLSIIICQPKTLVIQIFILVKGSKVIILLFI